MAFTAVTPHLGNARLKDGEGMGLDVGEAVKGLGGGGGRWEGGGNGLAV